jgi:hypothetical protein
MTEKELQDEIDALRQKLKETIIELQIADASASLLKMRLGTKTEQLQRLREKTQC